MGTTYHPLSKILLSSLLVLIFSIALSGQRTIHGKVTDSESNDGIIGANVVVKGSTVGTVTDFDGSYTIEVPAGFDVLSFSYTGYNTIEVTLSNSDEINIALGQGQLLDEVVMIGYGTVKRVDLTGSVQSVSSENFNRGSITGAQELLAGKIPGVVITTNDGAPGGGATIRIRGESSLTASNDPLIVVDGVPFDKGGVSGSRNPLSIINPNDIESMTVLKDASATAIYGSRASAGVILITTKKGNVAGGIKIGYSANLSVSNPSNLVDVLNADEFRAMLGTLPDSTDARLLTDTFDTFWQDEIYTTAIGHDHNIYASGALGDFPFRLSLGYTDKEGILKTDRFDRITAGLNLSPGLLDNTLQINFNFKTMFSNNHFADRGAIGNALSFDPTQTIYDTLSPFGGYRTWVHNSTGLPNNLAPTNPIALLDLRDDDSKETRYLASFSADYRLPFFTDLRANINLAYDYNFGEGTVKVPTFASFAIDTDNGGGVNNEYNQTKKNSLLELYLNYNKHIGRSVIDLMAGYSWQHFELDNFFRNSDAAGTPTETTTGSDPAELYLLAMFGRANFSFDDRYLLTLSLRRDGTSRFSPDTRWGLFPAAAVAVKVIDNDRTHFNNLKLRMGWGITGQQDIGNDYYAYLARYQLGNESARYQFGDEFITTLRPNGYDANIKWEETATLNLGSDISIIRNRLSSTIDVYQRNTKDLLNRIPVPAGTNLTNFVTTNVGNMETKGIEVGLNVTPVLTEKVTWDIGANFAYNNSEITKLTATDDPTYEGILVGGIAGGVGSTIQIHSVGYAPYSFYVYEQLYDESGQIIENSFVDRNSDGIVNGLDRYHFEKPAADYTMGITSRLNVGNFDFSFGGRASIGNYVYNNVQTDMGHLLRVYVDNGGGALWNVHQSAVDLNVYSQANLTLSDHFVKKADFFRMDHITLGYSFNDLIGDFLRISVTAQNPFVITSYDGLDPEIFGGIDNNFYPRSRTFVFGVAVEF